MEGAVAALERVDRFLAGVVEALPPSCTLLVASDHGNIEDTRTGHTRNPALGLASGAGADALADSVSALTDVAGAVLAHLGV
jgi:phosphopentomutase